MLLRTGEDVASGQELDVGEAGRNQEPPKLIIEEPSGDAAGPQADVLPRILRDRALEDDVRELKPPARPQDAMHLGEGGRLVGHEV